MNYLRSAGRGCLSVMDAAIFEAAEAALRANDSVVVDMLFKTWTNLQDRRADRSASQRPGPTAAE
jgi:hypothetical protein